MRILIGPALTLHRFREFSALACSTYGMLATSGSNRSVRIGAGHSFLWTHSLWARWSLFVLVILEMVLALARGELYALAGLKVLAVMSANLLEL